jgi:DNA relaxase NicK
MNIESDFNNDSYNALLADEAYYEFLIASNPVQPFSQAEQVEFTPKRSAFFEQMQQLEVFPYYNPFYETSAQQSKTDNTPITNRGVKVSKKEVIPGELYPPSLIEALGFSPDKNYEPLEDFRTIAVGNKSKYELVRIPLGMNVNTNLSFIDWVNFTFKTDDYFYSKLVDGVFEHKTVSLKLNDSIVADLSRLLVDVFGFGVTNKRPTGLNFYDESYDLGHNGWGTVCIGGQNNSVMVTVKGQGLLAAKSGWEQRLYDLLYSLPNSKLTRIDLAHDAFNSSKSINDYFQMYLADLFTTRGRRPSIEQRGDWVNESNKGRTLYVGSRKSGKLLRIYEKGLQLGGTFSDMFPNWVRVELEIRNDQRDLPLEMLIKAASYLAGAYPALAVICEQQEVLETRKKSFKCLVDRAIELTRHQFGKYIHFISGLFGIEQAFQILTHQKEDLPDNLDSSDYASFDKESYLTNLNIDFKPMAELLENFGNSFLDYNTFKGQPVLPF